MSFGLGCGGVLAQLPTTIATAASPVVRINVCIAVSPGFLH